MFTERAFADIMVTRVMTVSAKQKKGTFKRFRFRNKVVDHYDADGSDGLARCPLLSCWSWSREI